MSADLDEAPTEAPRHSARRRRWVRRHPALTAAAGVVVAVIVVLGAVSSWYQHAEAGSQGGDPVIVDVRDGASISSLEGQLVRAGVIDNSLAFHVYIDLHGSPTLVPGTYELFAHESFAEILAALGTAPNVFELVVPPGFTVSEIADRLGEFPGHGATFVEDAARRGVSPFEPPGSSNLDGLLAPGQYQLRPGESDATVLQQMVARFDAEARTASLVRGASSLGLSPYQLITAASIVQKEGIASQALAQTDGPNLPKVARVILNRLHRDMPLQMDSTVLYSLGQDGGPVTEADLRKNTPYNTYLHTGLPPTPICVPSVAALDAALHPAPGAWLFFVVVSEDGTMAFADTYSEQLANEQLAQERGLG